MRRRSWMAVLVALTTSAHAQPWTSTVATYDDGRKIGTASVTAYLQSLSVRCPWGAEPEVIFRLHGDWQPERPQQSVQLSFHLKGGERLAVPAQIEAYTRYRKQGNVAAMRAVARGDDLLPLIVKLSATSDDFAVELRSHGDVIESAVFTTTDAHKALRHIWSNCGSADGDYKKPTL